RLAPASHALPSARSWPSPPFPCACVPSPATPIPPRIGSLALVAYSHAAARLSLLLPASRASSPLPRVSRTSLVPVSLALSSRTMRVVPSAPASRSSTSRPRAPAALRVPAAP
ncbi:Unknown protein, partial [Striga hermonthica]